MGDKNDRTAPERFDMLIAFLLLATAGTTSTDPLASHFLNPPPSARPHTWWHWMNGNVTKKGITADLEAMAQAGIGGAQMFTVDQDIPAGPAKYGGPLWREMTAFAAKEAARLGLELCIHNGAGWSSSGGPWVKPADAMQVLAWSTTKVTGPQLFSGNLPMPKAPRVEAVVPYYEDIAVFAYPTPAEGDTPPRQGDFLQRTGVERGDGLGIDKSPIPAGFAVPRNSIIHLTQPLDRTGKLTWSVPFGEWTILRMGHVPTGIRNHPAPPEGEGLEVDKLSKEALDHFWDGLLSKVVSDAGLYRGKSFNNVLIDSYEVGSQNWTPKFRHEFAKRRGYDPLPYLPIVTGLIIDGKEQSERFLWDVRRTIADLFADNYYGHMAELAHKNGLKFSTEPYGNGGFDNIQSGSKADIPMAEFWLGGGAMETTKMVASSGHLYGHPIIGAESFTGDVMPGRWREEPYTMKALGDLAFCNGINRYIFHRWAMQPWTDLRPGMTMGPWGTHLERTQTWWTEAATWLEYVARCQYLLQEGQFQADVCYFYGEGGPNDLPYGQGLRPELPKGYDYDGCDAGAIRLMSVKNGRIVLPSGMSYKVLVLPNNTLMTPGTASKIKSLVLAGATIIGPKWTQSPSFLDYPECDDKVQAIAQQLWGPGATKAGGDRTVGKGRVVWGKPLDYVLKTAHVAPDFDYEPRNYGTKLIDIHRKIGWADVYFVSNQRNQACKAVCTFRISGKQPELWHPETGQIEDAPVFSEKNGLTSVPLNFDTAESVFVVFRKPAPKNHLVSLTPVVAHKEHEKPLSIVIDKARYQSADGRGADVTDTVRSMVKEGQFEIPATNGLFGDPVVNVVKQLVIEYRLNGQKRTSIAAENYAVVLTQIPGGSTAPKAFEVARKSSHEVDVTSWAPGGFAGRDSRGRVVSVAVASLPKPIELAGPWSISFPPNLGAPPSATFSKLMAWNDHSVPGIKYFSGTATYSKDFDVPAAFAKAKTAVRLNLGEVKNFATVSLNGKQVAVLWKPPFALDVSGFVHKGRNHLEVKVTNLWPNRIIGDEQLPPDVEWNGSHLKKWPDWLLNGKPRPKTGRVTFETWPYYDKNSPLLESGLIGPVTLSAAPIVTVRY